MKKDVPRKRPLQCPDCRGKLWLQDTRFGLAYLCEHFPVCRGAHGAHPNGEPLGTPASQDTKVARIRAHAAFDALWETAHALYDAKNDEEREYVLKVARKRAYAWLRDRMELAREDCHIARFSLAQCEKVVYLCAGMSPELVRAWAHEQKARAAVKAEERGSA